MFGAPGAFDVGTLDVDGAPVPGDVAAVEPAPAVVVRVELVPGACDPLHPATTDTAAMAAPTTPLAGAERRLDMGIVLSRRRPQPRVCRARGRRGLEPFSPVRVMDRFGRQDHTLSVRGVLVRGARRVGARMCAWCPGTRPSRSSR